MTQILPPTGAPQPYGQPYGQPVGAPGAPFGPPAPPFGYQPPKKKRTGLIIGSLVGALVLIGGLVVGALLLFGTKTLDTADAQNQIAALTQEQTGVAPTDVSCPADIEAQAGASFTCTASLEGQPISFTVTQTDDQGNVEFVSENTFVPVSAVQDDVSTQVEQSADQPVEVVTTCDADGRTVLVDPDGTQLTCTVANADDPSLSATVTVSVATDGSVTIDDVVQN